MRLAGGCGSGSSSKEMMYEFPEDILELVLVFLTSRKDRNSVSLVCKSWYRAEASSRAELFIGNCYSCSPETVVRRFTKIKSLTLKGKPRFADFNLLPPHWGAYLRPWIDTFAEHRLPLEELRLKRMTITDDVLLRISEAFPNFRVLVFENCDGFSTAGLACIARNCRNLEELSIVESIVSDEGGEWMRCFPETTTGLRALNFSCVNCSVDMAALDSLVARNPGLTNLGLNKKVTLGQLQRLLLRCGGNLRELSTGKLINGGDEDEEGMIMFRQAGAGEGEDDEGGIADVAAAECFAACTNLRELSGVWQADAAALAALRPLCSALRSLNLSYASLRPADLIHLLSHCHNLRRLWLQDTCEDEGLAAVAATCRELEELRVFPADHQGLGLVTEEGLVAVSRGCPRLSSLLYFCRRMTNAAIDTVSRNCPLMKRFRLCIIATRQPDHITGAPLDEGFAAVVRNCPELKRLAVSGLLTDRAFQYIGQYGKKIETLSIAFAGDSDAGLAAILRGCTRLRKLEIRDCPFGDRGLLAGLRQLESMRFLWLSGCRVSLGGCDALARRLPRVNVELVESNEQEYAVDMFYMYRTVMKGARMDRPRNVIGLRGGVYYWRWFQGNAPSLGLLPEDYDDANSDEWASA